MIKNVTFPIRMIPFLWIGMLIEVGAIKVDQTVFIIRKMGRNPVQNHPYPVPVKMIDKIHEILGSAISAGGGGGPDRLISPGTIERMLHHREKINMGEAHLPGKMGQ